MQKLKLAKQFLITLSIVMCAHTNANAVGCPTDFFDLSLPADSKQCRIFGVKKPSTISFFVSAPPNSVISALAIQLPDAKVKQQAWNTEIVSNQTEYRIYVHQDGGGTQVNIRAL